MQQGAAKFNRRRDVYPSDPQIRGDVEMATFWSKFDNSQSQKPATAIDYMLHMSNHSFASQNTMMFELDKAELEKRILIEKGLAQPRQSHPHTSDAPLLQWVGKTLVVNRNSVTKQCLVADVVSSAMRGSHFVLQDPQNETDSFEVPNDQFEEMVMHIMSDLQEGVSIQDFVQHIWGFDSTLLQSQQVNLSRVLEKDYARCVTGPGRCKAFCDLVEDAHNQVSQHVQLPKHHSLKLVPLMGSTPTFSDYNSQNSDDSYQSSAPSYQRPDAIVISEGVQHSDSSGRPLFKNIALCVVFKKDGTLSEEHQEEADRILSNQRSSEPTVSMGTKRKSDGRTTGQNKRAKVMTQKSDESQATEKELTRDELQLVDHTMRSLSDVGNRRFVTGIFVKDFSMTLWYFDRIGAIKSEELHFLREPNLFVLVVATLFSCDAEHLGYEPLLQHADRADWPFSSVKDSTLTLPFYSTSDSQKVETPVTFDVVDDALHVQYGLIGRGTVVLPVRLSPGSACVDFKADNSYVAKFSWQVHTRVAEDTLIRRIRRAVPPRWRHHITDLKLSLTIDHACKKLAFLPREYLKNLNGPAPEIRVLRILVSPRYRRLQDVHSLKEFKKVFVDTVRVHRVVFLKADILHRDLSIGNLMFRRDKNMRPYGTLNDWDLSEEVSSDPGDHDAIPGHRMGTVAFMAMELLADNPPIHVYRHDLESFFWILVWAALHFNLNGDQRPVNPLVYSWTEGSWDTMASAKREVLGPKFLDYISAITPAFRLLINEWIWPLRKLFFDYEDARRTRERRALRDLDPSLRVTGNKVEERKTDGDEYDGGFTDDEDDDFSSEDEVSGTREDQARKSRTPKDLNSLQNAGKLKLDLPPWNQDTADGTVTYEKFMEALGVSSELKLN
ncbi:hypothetical protein EVG20_g4966 [Dentipellis fragilis]|uniref:Protein kinase domain-containing protein n=1 Tax=Dentipellis fragilis TaxID=205917 RepID=A0A4Y9YWI8_9AGAM|nr:hypothetical protein EVG20_g4966 [Dentipellis fragilis]